MITKTIFSDKDKKSENRELHFFSKLKASQGENFTIFKASEEIQQIPEYSPMKILHIDKELSNNPEIVKNVCCGDGDTANVSLEQILKPKIVDRRKRVSAEEFSKFYELKKSENSTNLVPENGFMISVVIHVVIFIFVVAMIYLLESENIHHDFKEFLSIWRKRGILEKKLEPIIPKTFLETFIFNFLYYVKKIVNI